MRKTTFLYLGAAGSLLALFGGLGMQATSAQIGLPSANLTTAFTGGENMTRMADELSEALPDLRENVRVALPYAVLQMAGYALFSLGFVGIWRLTGRSLGFIAFIAVLLLGIMTLASFVFLPAAMEDLADLLREADQAGVPTSMPAALMVVALTGVLSLVAQLAGFVSGGYEFYRLGKEFDSDMYRGCGVLLMAAAVATFIPLIGIFIVVLAIGVTGLSFYLLGRNVDEVVGGPDDLPGSPVI